MHVFEGEDPIEIEAWFRYNVSNDGQLTLQYKMKQPAKIVRDESDAVLDRIKKQVDMPVFSGTIDGMLSPA